MGIIFNIIKMTCCCGGKKELNSERLIEDRVYDKNTLEEEKTSMEEKTSSQNPETSGKKSKKSPKKLKKDKVLKNEGKQLKFKDDVIDKHGDETKPVNQSNITIDNSMIEGDYHELVEIKEKQIKKDIKSRKKFKCLFCCKSKNVENEEILEVNLQSPAQDSVNDDIILKVKEDENKQSEN